VGTIAVDCYPPLTSAHDLLVKKVLNQCARLSTRTRNPGEMRIEVPAICFTATAVACMARQMPPKRIIGNCARIERGCTEVACTYARHAVKPLFVPAVPRKKICVVVTLDAVPRRLPAHGCQPSRLLLLRAEPLSACRQPLLPERSPGEPLALGHGPRVGERRRRLRRLPRQHGLRVGAIGEA